MEVYYAFFAIFGMLILISLGVGYRLEADRRDRVRHLQIRRAKLAAEGSELSGKLTDELKTSAGSRETATEKDVAVASIS